MSRLRTAFAASLALCALSAFAGTAAAAPAHVPPANSGAVQYTETLPGVSGDQTAKGLHEGKGSGKGYAKGHALSGADVARLEARGKEGKDAARLAADGSPPTGGGRGAGAQGTGGGESSGEASGPGQVLGTATGSSDSGGMGLLLPLLIAAGVLAAIALVIVRRNTPPDPD